MEFDLEEYIGVRCRLLENRYLRGSAVAAGS